MSGMTHEQIEAWFEAHFPNYRKMMSLDSVRPGRARLRMRIGERQLRPGGTVSGPSMMMLADAAVYAALLAVHGDAGDSVTSSFNIAFLKRPGPSDILADAEILQLGRRLVVGEVRLRSEGEDRLVAQATATYVRP
jgi:uncharacterized protein (TIGR00369 family)